MTRNAGVVLRTVGAIGQRVRRARSRQQLVDEVLTEFIPALGASRGAVYLFVDQPLQVFSRGVAERYVARYLDAGVSSDPLLEYLKQHHAPVHERCVFSAAEWRMHPLFTELVCPAGMEHYLLSPIVGRGAVIGALTLGRVASEGTFADLEMCGAALTAMNASIALASMTGESDEAADALSGLSRRERQVVELVARGLVNQEVAGVLSVSQNTVKKHLKAAFAKLNVTRRAELAWLVGLTEGRAGCRGD